VLMATNQLQFGNLFNRYTPSNRVMRDLLQSGDDRIIEVSTKGLTQVYRKGKMGTMGALGKIAKDFGKKEAMYQLGKSFVKNVGKFQVSEGIQENIQETSGEAWRNY